MDDETYLRSARQLSQAIRGRSGWWDRGPWQTTSRRAWAMRRPVGRPLPRILAGVPVCVTDAPDRARAAAAERLKLYGFLPAYRATLAREGLDGPEGLLAAGTEDEVRERIAAYESAGATDLRVSVLCATTGEAERTHAFLRGLCAEKNQR